MAAPSLSPTGSTPTPPVRRLRRLRPRLSDTHPLRRLWEIAEFPPLFIGGIVLWIWQERGNPTFGETSIALLVIMLYIAFLLHLRRESRERSALLERQEVALLEQPTPTASPPPSPTKRGPGRPPVNPSGHSPQAARRKSRQLHELRDQGVTWKEAARQVNLSVKQAQHLYHSAPHLREDQDQ